MANKKWTCSERRLRELYTSLCSADKVAKELNVSKKLVFNYMKKFSIETNKRSKKKTIEKINALKTEYMTVKEIAIKINASETLVNRYIKEAKIKVMRYHKGFTVNDAGYVFLREPSHPRADSKGYVREHILVVESRIGRFLGEHEVIHHIDRQKDNNEQSNLVIMSKFNHKSLHSKEKRKSIQLD